MIVTIILTKVILKDTTPPQLSVEQNDIELVSPDLTLQPAEEENNEIVAPASEANKEVNNEIAAPAPEPVQEEKTVEKPAPEPAIIPESKEESEAEPAVPVLPQPVEEPVKAEPKIEVKKVEVPKIEPIPEKTIEKAAETPDSRPANVLTRPGENSTYNSSATSEFYIQVGSFKYDPGQQFINKIVKNGFHYKVITSKSGSKKFLVGPYPDRQSVDQALIQVRKRITKDAFVYKK